MGTATMIAGALVSVAACAAFFAVAHEIQRRRVSEGSRLALVLLRGWWLAVGVYGLLWAGVIDAMAAFGVQDVRLYAAVRTVAFLILLVGLWALTAHFAYLVTGSQRALVPLGLFYAATYALVTFTFAASTPVAIEGTWVIDIRYDPAPDPRFLTAIMVGAFLPQLATCVGYLVLSRRVGDPASRRRARLVALALALWLASSLVASLLQSEIGRFVTRPLIGLAAAGVVYLAYRPLVWQWPSSEGHSLDARLRDLI